MARRRAFAALAALLVALSTLGTAAPAVAAPASPEPLAWILVDAGSGAVLAAKDAHTPLPPASTAKIMTALTAAERLPADSLVPVSELAASQPASKMTMLPGEKWPLDQAMASLLMVSANDAAYALAEATSGSLDGFAAALTATAARYGMKDSTLSDPAGFDDASSFKGGPRMSAYDIAISTRNALAVPQLAYLAALPELDFTDPSGNQRHLVNHNKMLAGKADEYAGATGFKTGYTKQAGHTLVATASRDGRTLIAIILNTYDAYGWARQLLDQGFATPSGDAGTGEKLPPVRVSPYAERLADKLAFLRLTKGDAAATVAGSTTTSAAATGAASATSTTASDETAAGRTTTRTSAQAAAERGRSSGAGLMSPRALLVLALAMLTVVVALRRRAVRRHRARRLARRRATAEMMRRGGLPVVDGRYRTGTRTGQPPQSHVRVERLAPRPRPAPRARTTPRGGA